MQKHFTKLKLSILALLFSLTMVKAQTYTMDTTGFHVHTWSCGIDSTFWQQMNLNPDNATARIAYDTNALIMSTNTVTPTTYTIPVVFHVLSTSTSTVVLPYEQIKWQVAALNAAYENQMVAFRGGSVGYYTANAKVVFVLACNAEPLNGTGYNPTTGAPNGWTNVNEPGVVRYNVKVGYYRVILITITSLTKQLQQPIREHQHLPIRGSMPRIIPNMLGMQVRVT